MHRADVSELIDIAKKINSGEYEISNITVSEDSELYKIAKYFLDAVKSLKEITAVVDKQAGKLPVFDTVLEDIRKLNKSAVENILTYVDKLNLNIDAVKEYIVVLNKDLQKKDKSSLLVDIGKFKDIIIEGQGICFDLITFLEFQDVVKNKLNKLSKVIREVEDMLSELIVKIGIKEGNVDIDKIDFSKKEESASQDIVDQLLKEFGL
jgi:chemotaxis protein CheZ